MRLKRTAAVSAVCMVTGVLVPITAHAAAPSASTIYVNNGSAGCSDTGTGTQAVPYCTVQAAAGAVQPGQTVQIEPGVYYGQVTLTTSGTSAEPIRFVGYSGIARSLDDSSAYSIGNQPDGGAAPALGLEFDGASYVTVSGIRVNGGATNTVAFVNASHDELASGFLNGSAAVAVSVSGSSADDTVDRDFVPEGQISVGSGASGTVVSGNIMEADSAISAITASGATGTVVDGNSIVLGGPATSSQSGIVLTDGSTGSTIENNILTGLSQTFGGVSVDSSSVSGTKLDYNIVFSNRAANPSPDLYSWAGTAYAAAAALDTATGQGAHDLNANPLISWGQFTPTEGSPAINSADASAPGEYSTDFFGGPRDNDPSDPDTGTGVGYYDRGAVEVQDPIGISVAPGEQWGAGSLTDTFTVSQTATPWSSTVTYRYDFGDGSSAVTSASTTATHTYTAPGTYTTTVTATDGANGQAAATTSVKVESGSAYYPISPLRVLDTRTGTGTNGVVAQIAPNHSVKLKIAGVGPVPGTGVTAVVLTLTATNDPGNGFVTAYPDGENVPNTSSLNYAGNVNVPNLVTVQLGADGTVDLFNGGTSAKPIDLVADLEGYYAPGGGDGFFNAGPERLLDTRNVGESVPAGGSVDVSAPTDLGVASSNISALVLNVTVTNAHGSGFVTAFPAGGTAPNASNVNYVAGQTVPDLVVVPVGSNGQVQLSNLGGTAGTIDIVVDLFGFYVNNWPGEEAFTPAAPVRLIDTRNGTGVPSAGPMWSQGQIYQPISDYPQVPGTAGNVVLNVTVTAPQAGGVIDLATSGPSTSNLNFAPGQTISNGVYSGWATYDVLGFNNDSNGSTQLVVDYYGYFS